MPRTPSTISPRGQFLPKWSRLLCRQGDGAQNVSDLLLAVVAHRELLYFGRAVLEDDRCGYGLFAAAHLYEKEALQPLEAIGSATPAITTRALAWLANQYPRIAFPTAVEDLIVSNSELGRQYA